MDALLDELSALAERKAAEAAAATAKAAQLEAKLARLQAAVIQQAELIGAQQTELDQLRQGNAQGIGADPAELDQLRLDKRELQAQLASKTAAYDALRARFTKLEARCAKLEKPSSLVRDKGADQVLKVEEAVEPVCGVAQVAAAHVPRRVTAGRAAALRAANKGAEGGNKPSREAVHGGESYDLEHAVQVMLESLNRGPVEPYYGARRIADYGARPIRYPAPGGQRGAGER